MKCAKCNTVYQPGVKFCVKCGASLYKCSNCGTEGENGPFCVKCGKATGHTPTNQASCPKCGSLSLSPVKKGYDWEKGCCGFALLGPCGIFCGGKDANDIKICCLACGYNWTVKG